MKRVLAVVLCLAGCGVAPPVGEEELGATEDALSTQQKSYVALRRDYRRCAAPRCGGYFVRDLNFGGNEQYVYALNFSQSGLDAASKTAVRDQPEDVVLVGKLSKKNGHGLRRFIVHEAYRGMPGSTPAAGSKFYTVSERFIQCADESCLRYGAKPVNKQWNGVKHFARLDVTSSLRPFVDASWLENRVLAGQAIAAGTFLEMAYDLVDGPGAPIHVLDASQVYVRLPDSTASCPMFKLAACPGNEMWTYTRSPDRCVMPVSCEAPLFCTLSIPVCDADYVLASWTGRGGCPQYACDPKFVEPQVGGQIIDPTPEPPVLTVDACTTQGGEIIGDIGDGSIYRDGCPSGRTLLGYVPLGIEGSICCGP